jgi:hypothetical protein
MVGKGIVAVNPRALGPINSKKVKRNNIIEEVEESIESDEVLN